MPRAPITVSVQQLTPKPGIKALLFVSYFLCSGTRAQEFDRTGQEWAGLCFITSEAAAEGLRSWGLLSSGGCCQPLAGTSGGHSAWPGLPHSNGGLRVASGFLRGSCDSKIKGPSGQAALPLLSH